MIRAFWLWLTGRKPIEPPTVESVAYNPERDPVVRAFRLERRQSERAVRRMRRNPIERTVLGNREAKP